MPQKKSIMRSLGEFVGHVSKAVKTPVEAKPPVRIASDEPPPPKPASGTTPSAAAAPNTGEVRRVVEERTAETPNGPVVLRRTVIDEVVTPRVDRPSATDRAQK